MSEKRQHLVASSHTAIETFSHLSETILASLLQYHREWVGSGWEAGERADLHGVDLHASQLQGSTLRDADLHDANLEGADLQEADLDGADLHGAKLSAACLEHASCTGPTCTTPTCMMPTCAMPICATPTCATPTSSAPICRMPCWMAPMSVAPISGQRAASVSSCWRRCNWTAKHGCQPPSGKPARCVSRRLVRYGRNSHQTGAWSDGFSQPRGVRSTPAECNRSAVRGDSSRWSIRNPRSAGQAPAR